mmetsp:Transcript_19331/g.31660  ORF Transcript_19331/g.31660 Transcript_19331/m.31660 type:complete len:251 (-) Transcript_19331:400-1152(-)
MSLGVGIGEDASLKHLVIGVVDARNNDGGAEGEHFVLEEVVVDVAVQDHSTNGPQWEHILRPRFSHIQGIEIELVFICRVHGLYVELPLRELALLDRVIQVLSRVAVVLSTDDCRLLVHQRLHTACGLPVILDPSGLAVASEPCVGVDTKALHVPVISRDTDIVQKETEHVAALGMVGEEVPDAPPLLDVVFGIGLEGVDHVRELVAVFDEEHGHVVAHEIVVALASVELDSEAPRVSEGLRRPTLMDHS